MAASHAAHSLDGLVGRGCSSCSGEHRPRVCKQKLHFAFFMLCDAQSTHHIASWRPFWIHDHSVLLIGFKSALCSSGL